MQHLVCFQFARADFVQMHILANFGLTLQIGTILCYAVRFMPLELISKLSPVLIIR